MSPQATQWQAEAAVHVAGMARHLQGLQVEVMELPIVAEGRCWRVLLRLET